MKYRNKHALKAWERKGGPHSSTHKRPDPPMPLEPPSFAIGDQVTIWKIGLFNASRGTIVGFEGGLYQVVFPYDGDQGVHYFSEWEMEHYVPGR